MWQTFNAWGRFETFANEATMLFPSWVALLILAQPLPGEALVEERLQVGQGWKVKSRSEIGGTLHLPAPGGKSTRSLLVTGESALEYEEAILALSGTGDMAGVARTLRLYKRADLKRKMGDQDQSSGIRPAVRKVVLVRQGSQEVPFSPDGPLTLNEIEMVRTDLFTPALAGLLPGRVVTPGATWEAKPDAVRELTDMLRVDEGKLECTLAEFQNIQNQQVARIRFEGKVVGANQDGPCKQEIEGQAYFDLNGKYLAYLSLNGKHTLPGGQGYPASTLQGRFVLTREKLEGPGELGAVQPNDTRYEPGEDNTLLVEELPTLRLEYPRRWKYIQGGARQITLDGADGSGLLITLEPAGRVPSPVQYQLESRAFLERGGHRIVGGEQAQMLSSEISRFTLEAEKDGKRIHLEYYVRNTQLGGILLAARFPGDYRNARPDLERLIRRSTLTSPVR
jgi:hypothetical protein